MRERWIGDNFIANFGSEERSKAKVEGQPREKRGWHWDNDWFRQFLDSSSTAMTIIHCYTDIPAHGGGTWLCEDGIAREFSPCCISLAKSAALKFPVVRCRAAFV